MVDSHSPTTRVDAPLRIGCGTLIAAVFGGLLIIGVALVRIGGVGLASLRENHTQSLGRSILVGCVIGALGGIVGTVVRHRAVNPEQRAQMRQRLGKIRQVSQLLAALGFTIFLLADLRFLVILCGGIGGHLLAYAAVVGVWEAIDKRFGRT